MKVSVFFDNLGSFIVDHSREFISSFIVLLISVLAILVGYLVEKKYVSKNDKKKHLVELAKNINSFYRGLIIFIAVLIICSSWGVNVTAVLIGFGIFLIVIALGTKKVIADIVNGLLISFSNYYDIDDVVEINGFIGYVKEITLKNTKLVNLNNEIKVISNSQIVEFTNYSKLPHAYSFEMIIDRSSDIKKVVELLEDRYSNFDDKFDNIIEGPNLIGITDVINQGYLVKVVVKTKYDLYNTTISYVKNCTKEILDQNNINFKFREGKTNE